MNNKRFYSLDAFRGLCAISVVLYHLHVKNSITDFVFFRNSDLFVELFFCLSGFVMCHSYGLKKIESVQFSVFFKSRFFRLYPLHFTMLVVYIILELLKLFAYNFFGFNFNVQPFTGVYSVDEIIPNLLLIQSWSFQTEAYSFNTPSWSISVEFYMYFLLYLTLFLSKVRYSLWFVISFVSFIFLYFDIDIITPYSLRGLSCFFLGCVMYVVYNVIKDFRLGYFLGSVIEIIILFLLYFTIVTDFINKDIVASLLFSIVVLVFAFEFGVISKFLRYNILQMLGKLSYSIYLVHAALIFIVLSFLMIIGKFSGGDLTPMINNIRYMSVGGWVLANFFVLAVLIIVVFVSSFTYKNIEVKFSMIGKSKSKE